MKKRDLRLAHYGITAERYRELKYICLQYDQYKKRLAAIKRGEVDVSPSGNYIWHGRPDPTASEAIRRACNFAASRIAAIEQSAIAADPALCEYILRNVARGTRFEELNVPCGRRQFFQARKLFFYELDSRV